MLFALLRAIIILYITYLLAAFWTSIVFVRTIITFIRNPSGYFYVKSRPNQPEVLKRGFRHSLVKLPNDIQIHYVEGGDSQRPLLLFLHGFPEFWYSWRHQLREFQNDHYVVAIDMRGYGESSKPKSIGAYKIGALVDDVRYTISALGKAKCVLIAHDWGGIVAWRLAIQNPELVEKLIILNSPHPKAFTDRLAGLSLTQLLRSWYMFYFQCPFLPEITFRANDMKLLVNMLTKPPAGCKNPNALTDEDIEAWKYTFQQKGAMTGPLNYYRAFIPRMAWKSGPVGPVEQNVGSRNTSTSPWIVQSPTLIIWGTNDIALETVLAHGSLQYCQKGVLRLIEGASHWVQQDQPHMCNQCIRDFLNS